jgi:hypothetical protein
MDCLVKFTQGRVVFPRRRHRMERTEARSSTVRMAVDYRRDRPAPLDILGLERDY